MSSFPSLTLIYKTENFQVLSSIVSETLCTPATGCAFSSQCPGAGVRRLLVHREPSKVLTENKDPTKEGIEMSGYSKPEPSPLL